MKLAIEQTSAVKLLEVCQMDNFLDKYGYSYKHGYHSFSAVHRCIISCVALTYKAVFMKDNNGLQEIQAFKCFLPVIHTCSIHTTPVLLRHCSLTVQLYE